MNEIAVSLGLGAQDMASCLAEASHAQLRARGRTRVTMSFMSLCIFSNNEAYYKLFVRYKLRYNNADKILLRGQTRDFADEVSMNGI